MTMDTATAMQLTKGFKVLDTAPEEVVAVAGGISPKPVAPPPSAGLLAFMTVGGVPEPRPAPSMAGVVVVGDIVAGDAEEEEEEEDVVNMQEPELGLTLVIIAVPPKSQLV